MGAVDPEEPAAVAVAGGHGGNLPYGVYWFRVWISVKSSNWVLTSSGNLAGSSMPS